MSARPALRPHPRRDSGPRAPARLRVAREPDLVQQAAGQGTIARARLTRPLLDGAWKVAVLVAPAGYGKSTVLAEWRAQDPRPFAWMAMTPCEDDPDRLIARIAAALCEIQPLPADAVAPSATIADLTSALASMRPAVLVLDDLHVLRSEAARAIVSALMRHAAPRTTVAIASRTDPALRLARLRAQDEVAELRTASLAMTADEAAELLRGSGLHLTAAQADRLVAQASGWPAALQLAARAVREQEDVAGAVEAFAGDDGIVADYVREEVLAGLTDEDRVFLSHASVLETLDGPVCDAVLGREDSAARLRTLAGGNALLTPLDRAGTQFRQHPLVAQALRRELQCADPRLERDLHSRASQCYEREGDVERAVEHGLAAHDPDRVCELLAHRAPGLVAAGRAALMQRWLDRVGEADVAARPPLALAAALAAVARGERDAAERWAAIAVQRSGAPRDVKAGAAVVRAAVARDGVEAIADDAARAYAASAQGPWTSFACLLEGSSHHLCGRTGEARARLEEGARRAVFDGPLVRSLCLAELSLMALEGGDSEDAAELAAKARAAIERDGDGEYPLAALTFAVSSLALASHGNLKAAQRDIAEATRLLAMLPDAAPWFGAMVRVAIARAALRLSDACEARRLLTEASRLVGRAPGAVALQAWIDDAWARADDFAAGPVSCPSVLTIAELRVLRFLPSHLTFREIAARLHVSANTVKTQAHAAYRKLDARSRSEAVTHARAIGLLDG